jgi:Tol biopolymer transport system component
VDLGVGADPGWSPDGASILFSAPPDDVWLMAADGADRRPLTDTTDQVTQNNPAWTPDGTQIVFVRWRQEGGTLLNIAAADGSSARLLTPVVDGSTTAARRYRPTVRGSPSAGSLSTQRAAR